MLGLWPLALQGTPAPSPGLLTRRTVGRCLHSSPSVSKPFLLALGHLSGLILSPAEGPTEPSSGHQHPARLPGAASSSAPLCIILLTQSPAPPTPAWVTSLGTPTCPKVPPPHLGPQSHLQAGGVFPCWAGNSTRDVCVGGCWTPFCLVPQCRPRGHHGLAPSAEEQRGHFRHGAEKGGAAAGAWE